MDKRSALRIEVNGQVCGKMVLVESLEILDISMTGIRFNCMRRVDMNSPHRIKIEQGDILITLKGKIVRSTFRGLQQVDGKNMPVYEVAMHFDPSSEREQQHLEKLISLLCHE